MYIKRLMVLRWKNCFHPVSHVRSRIHASLLIRSKRGTLHKRGTFCVALAKNVCVPTQSVLLGGFSVDELFGGGTDNDLVDDGRVLADFGLAFYTLPTVGDPFLMNLWFLSRDTKASREQHSISCWHLFHAWILFGAPLLGWEIMREKLSQ